MSSGHLIIWWITILWKTVIFLWNTWIICAHSESCFGDLIEQSGYLVVIMSETALLLLIGSELQTQTSLTQIIPTSETSLLNSLCSSSLPWMTQVCFLAGVGWLAQGDQLRPCACTLHYFCTNDQTLLYSDWLVTCKPWLLIGCLDDMQQISTCLLNLLATNLANFSALQPSHRVKDNNQLAHARIHQPPHRTFGDRNTRKQVRNSDKTLSSHRPRVDSHLAKLDASQAWQMVPRPTYGRKRVRLGSSAI